MSKYIDADKLIALIDTKLEDLGMSSSIWVGRIVLQELKEDIITSLQQEQPEVDLEKEVSNYLKTHHLHIKDGGRVVFDNDDSPNFMCDIRDIARHFYELGKNARKEE